MVNCIILKEVITLDLIELLVDVKNAVVSKLIEAECTVEQGNYINANKDNFKELLKINDISADSHTVYDDMTDTYDEYAMISIQY